MRALQMVCVVYDLGLPRSRDFGVANESNDYVQVMLGLSRLTPIMYTTSTGLGATLTLATQDRENIWQSRWTRASQHGL